METVNPTLRFVFDLIMAMKCGTALQSAVASALNCDDSDFYQEMQVWWLCRQNKADYHLSFSTDHRKVLSEILDSGLEGVSILQNLEDFYIEVEAVQDIQLQGYLEKLPFRLMLPLVCFFFPSILILMFGPLLTQIYQEVLR